MKKPFDWRWVAVATMLLVLGVTAGVLGLGRWRAGRVAEDLRPDRGIRSGVLQSFSLDEPSGQAGDPAEATPRGVPPEEADTGRDRPPSAGVSATETEKLIGEAWTALNAGDIDRSWERVDDYLDAGGSEDDIADLLWKLDLAEEGEEALDMQPGDSEELRLFVDEFRQSGAGDEAIAELLDELRSMGVDESEIAELKQAAADSDREAQAEGFRLGRRADSETKGFRLGRAAGEPESQSEVVTLSAFGAAEGTHASAVFQVTPADAEVFLDGKLLGQASALNKPPGGVAVPAGKHTVKITRRGYAPETYEMIFAPGGATVIAIDLRKQR